MASTQTFVETLAKALAESDPNRIADCLREYGIGMHLSPLKYTALLAAGGATAVTFAGTTPGATAAAAFLALASPGPQTPALPQGQLMLPPALSIATLRVTTGPSGAVGPYLVQDSGGTVQRLQLSGVSGAQVLDTPGIALLSDDGATLTFPVAVSGFVIEYISRGAQDVNLPFEHS